EERTTIKHLIRHTAEHVASMYGASTEIIVHAGSPALINDPRLIELVEHVVVDSHGPDAVYWVPVPSMGSEDFAHYVQHVPGAMIRLGTSSTPETSHTLHDCCFDIDESVLAPAARTAANILLTHLRTRPFNAA